MLDRIKFRICTANWSALPDWLWFLIASPLLRWAFGPPGRWFVWPLCDDHRLNTHT